VNDFDEPSEASGNGDAEASHLSKFNGSSGVLPTVDGISNKEGDFDVGESSGSKENPTMEEMGGQGDEAGEKGEDEDMDEGGNGDRQPTLGDSVEGSELQVGLMIHILHRLDIQHPPPLSSLQEMHHQELGIHQEPLGSHQHLPTPSNQHLMHQHS
jgi:hypothetical protein